MNLAILLLLAVPAADPDPLETKARAFITRLEKAEFDDAAKEFEPIMAKALPADKLKALWEKLMNQVGPLQKQEKARQDKTGPFSLVFVTCKFEKATLDVKVVFDKSQKITGLNIVPVQSADTFPTPPYAKKDAFTEKDVRFGAAEWELPGTLTIPKGDGPFPAVVLVHGSGPQDRDETIGAVKTFRDLAWGLASKGVAVFRYEKRTKEYSLKFSMERNATVKEETIDDALAAAALLRTTAKIDPKRIFIIGHSLGAMLAPKMALTDKKLAGIALLASPSRPLEDLLLEQTDRILAKNEPLPPDQQKLLESLRSVGKLIKDGKLNLQTPRTELVGAGAVYWLSIAGYRPPTDAVKLDLPIFILQGEGDVQVLMIDFDGWKKVMADRKNVTLKSYPKLGHSFTVSDGDPAAYGKPANVPEEVINDLVAWIGKH